MIYTEHELAKKLRDNSVSEYKPNWNKNDISKEVVKKEEIKENLENKEKEKMKEITFDNF